MPEYIEREILFNTLQLAAKASGAMGRHDSAGIYASAASLVAEQPAADVVPVVHGRWRTNPLGRVTCNKCYQSDATQTRYCPYCGARMDAKEDAHAD